MAILSLEQQFVAMFQEIESATVEHIESIQDLELKEDVRESVYEYAMLVDAGGVSIEDAISNLKANKVYTHPANFS